MSTMRGVFPQLGQDHSRANQWENWDTFWFLKNLFFFADETRTLVETAGDNKKNEFRQQVGSCFLVIAKIFCLVIKL